MFKKKSDRVNIDWSKVDFNVNDTQLAKELCVSTSLVFQHRKRMGIPAIVKNRKYTWEDVDWSLTDCDIARRKGDGRSQASCRYIRMKLGIPCHPVGRQTKKKG